MKRLSTYLSDGGWIPESSIAAPFGGQETVANRRKRVGFLKSVGEIDSKLVAQPQHRNPKSSAFLPLVRRNFPMELNTEN